MSIVYCSLNNSFLPKKNIFQILKKTHDKMNKMSYDGVIYAKQRQVETHVMYVTYRAVRRFIQSIL